MLFVSAIANTFNSELFWTIPAVVVIGASSCDVKVVDITLFKFEVESLLVVSVNTFGTNSEVSVDLFEVKKSYFASFVVFVESKKVCDSVDIESPIASAFLFEESLSFTNSCLVVDDSGAM